MARTLSSALLPLMLTGATHAAPPVSPVTPMFKPLVGNIPPAVKGAMALGTRYDPQAQIDLALTLPLRNKAELDDFDEHLFDPSDPLYHQYLTIQEMTNRFSPTQAEYNAVIAFAKSRGLIVTHTSMNRMLVDVSGPAATVEAAFGVHLMQFRDKDGRIFHAPDREPSVPVSLAPHLLGVIGLDNDAVPISQLVRGKPFASKAQQMRPMVPHAKAPGGPPDPTDPTPKLTIAGTAVAGTGAVSSPRFTGPRGGISPNDIKTAYNLNSVPSNGQGQILDMVELIGFNPSDITAYEDAFGLPHVPIQIISVDGTSNVYNNATSIEPTLDIDLAVAVAPGLSLIRVYEGPNSSKGLLDILNTIGINLAYQTSCSWAFTETALSSSQKQSEGNFLQSMISTGNCFFSASGDWGPYDSSRNIVTAIDPASQGFACAVGGTTLFTDQFGNYSSEQTWNQPATSLPWVASGGGISNYWTIRNQKPVITAASGGSTTMRNVPDVSLNAFSDYAIYYAGGWSPWGGTSAATPIWASFLALVNSRLNGTSFQQVPPLADLTSTLYSIAQGPRYHIDFHDIADGSNNRQFQNGPGNQAVPGYDLTTGLGSFNGANLFGDLVAAAGGR